MKDKHLVDKILYMLPYWHYRIEKPLKQLQKKEGMSLEIYYCLQMLKREGTMSMSALSHRLHISKQQATKMINTLDKQQFIERIYDTKDRRMIQIKPTPKAIQYIEDNTEMNEAFLKILKQEFHDKEIDAFSKIMDALIDIFTQK